MSTLAKEQKEEKRKTTRRGKMDEEEEALKRGREIKKDRDRRGG